MIRPGVPTHNPASPNPSPQAPPPLHLPVLYPLTLSLHFPQPNTLRTQLSRRHCPSQHTTTTPQTSATTRQHCTLKALRTRCFSFHTQHQFSKSHTATGSSVCSSSNKKKYAYHHTPNIIESTLFLRVCVCEASANKILLA